MNPDARKFFEDNPSEPYWYYTEGIRVPNPRLRPWTFTPRTPWPSERPIIRTQEES